MREGKSVDQRSSPAAVFSFEFPPTVGGIGRLASELAAGLRRRGVPVAILTQATDWAAVNEGHGDIGVHSVAARRPLREMQAWSALRRVLRSRTVISAIWYPEGLVAQVSGAKYRIVLAHGLELMPHEARWRRPVWNRLMRMVLSSASLVVANSRYTEGLVRRVAPEARVVAIPLGVDVERFHPGDKQGAKARLGVQERKVVLTVARLVPYKGHDTVLRALALLPPDERAELVYLVTGTGTYREALQTLARRLGVADTVRWLGRVPEHALPDVYRAADLFVLCTREDPAQQVVEGFGLAFLEAQACGVPVVGTHTGGIPDAVKEGRGGWLIAQDDYVELAQMFRRLLSRPEEFEAAGKLARQRVEREATWDQYVESFVEQCRRAGIPLG